MMRLTRLTSFRPPSFPIHSPAIVNWHGRFIKKLSTSKDVPSSFLKENKDKEDRPSETIEHNEKSCVFPLPPSSSKPFAAPSYLMKEQDPFYDEQFRIENADLRTEEQKEHDYQIVVKELKASRRLVTPEEAEMIFGPFPFKEALNISYLKKLTEFLTKTNET